MLMSKNVNNNVSKDSPIGHTCWQVRSLASSRCVQGSEAAVVGLAGQVALIKK